MTLVAAAPHAPRRRNPVRAADDVLWYETRCWDRVHGAPSARITTEQMHSLMNMYTHASPVGGDTPAACLNVYECTELDH